MKIFAIVVTWRGMKWYDRCLGSLRDSEVPVETIVVDNASGNGSVEYIREHFPYAVLLPQSENLGFAKANNIGIRYAIDHGADYVFLLNQDAWVETDTIGKLVETFKCNDGVGIASPIHLNGEKSALDHVFVTDVPYECVSDMCLGKSRDVYDTKFVSAAAWMLSSECIRKVGGFDSCLFQHYGEDNNYCQRVLFHGLRIVLNTRCSVYHDRSQRKRNDSDYRNFNFRQELVSKCIEYGNVLEHIDIDYLIKSAKKGVLIAKMKLRFKLAKKRTQRLAFYESVKFSRETNIRGGMVWL